MSYSDSVLVLYSYTPGDVPSAGDMQRPGRFAINYADGKLFYLDVNGVVQQFVVPMGVAAGLTIDSIGDATVTGKALVRAANAAAVRTLLSLIPGTAANNLIQLDSTAKLPAVDGSQLINLPAASGTPSDGSVTTAKIVDKNVTLAKLANIAAATILGNNTGAAASPIALTAAQVKTLLAIAAGDVSGLGTAATLNAGTAVGNLVQVLTGGKLPVLDGSNLTNLPSSGGAGKLVDRTYVGTGANSFTTSTIPRNNTKPQVTAGSQLFSVNFTPKSATNTLRITASLQVGCSAADVVTAAIFVNGAADAVAAGRRYINAAADAGTLGLQYEFVPGSIAQQTISLRYGPSNAANQANINGDGATGATLGGSAISSMIIEELLT